MSKYEIFTGTLICMPSWKHAEKSITNFCRNNIPQIFYLQTINIEKNHQIRLNYVQRLDLGKNKVIKEEGAIPSCQCKKNKIPKINERAKVEIHFPLKFKQQYRDCS